jgi:hypothetical protein
VRSHTIVSPMPLKPQKIHYPTALLPCNSITASVGGK